MYENMTFENILKRMLSCVSDSMDKREGSVIYDALAPVAMELAGMYIELGQIANEAFPDTASRNFLIKRCAERGITPKEPVKAVLYGEFTPVSVDFIGKRFSANRLTYTVTGKTEDGKYLVECETPGSEGNDYSGLIVPIEYIDGLETARLTEVLIPGEDEEDTEALRQRYFDSLVSQAFGGNIRDYEEKVMAIPGVGGVRLKPRSADSAPNGEITLTISGSGGTVPDKELVEKVQSIMDPKGDKTQGYGFGLAPIGHLVNVVGCGAEAVNIKTAITFTAGNDKEYYAAEIYSVIDDYFSKLAQTWGGDTEVIIRASHLEARLLQLPGILDISGTTVNSQRAMLVVRDNVPVRGEVIIE